MTMDVSLSNLIAQRALRTPERRALTFEGHTYTFGALQSAVERQAGAFSRMGLRRGDRVAFLGLNQPEFLIALFAASHLGAIFVPVNFRLTGPEIAFIVGDSGSRFLIVDPQHRPLADTLRGVLPDDTLYLTFGQPADGWAQVSDPGDGGCPPGEVSSGDTAIIMYTSGTTGRPKGAMLTHDNLWASNVNVLATFDVLQDDVTLTAAPLFHIGGLNVLTLVTLIKGGEVVLHRSFDPGKALDAIASHKVTTMFGVPAMFQFMQQHPTFDPGQLATLRIAVCGGAPCPEPLLKYYLDLGIAMQQGYGLTETAPWVSFLSPEYGLRKLGSAGRTPIFVDLRIVDGEGRETERGRAGEICVRGPNILPGYWRMAEASADAIRDGWFHTGDIGYVDEDGFLFICDRLKDMIISGGENVYPAEVESVLFRHPAIAEVAVVGVPDGRWGEVGVALVVPKPGATIGLDDMQAFARTSLARFKVPARLVVLDAMPRTASGKVQKNELRMLLAERPDRPA